MAGLVPAIHVFALKNKDVDARDKRGHDENKFSPLCRSIRRWIVLDTKPANRNPPWSK
jgi:hypothetical protein